LRQSCCQMVMLNWSWPIFRQRKWKHQPVELQEAFEEKNLSLNEDLSYSQHKK
jgi:hypothetical protein